MRILVVGSCGKKKRFSSQSTLDCNELSSKNSLLRLRNRFHGSLSTVREMYTGHQTRELVKGVKNLRRISGVTVTFKILSAGFGLLNEDEIIPPYDCSFSSMKKLEIQERSKQLSIGVNFQELISKNFDLVYLALGSKYLLALGQYSDKVSQGAFIHFGRDQSSEHLVRLPANRDAVMAFSKNGHKIHGIAGFKGDLLRILSEYVLEQHSPYYEVQSWMNPVTIRNIFYRLGNLTDDS